MNAPDPYATWLASQRRRDDAPDLGPAVLAAGSGPPARVSRWVWAAAVLAVGARAAATLAWLWVG